MGTRICNPLVGKRCDKQKPLICLLLFARRRLCEPTSTARGNATGNTDKRLRRPLHRPHQPHELLQRLFIKLCSLALVQSDRAYELSLPVGRDAAIARQRGLDVLVSEILAPGLEVLDGWAHPLAELDERIAKRVRVEIAKASTRECLANDLSDWRGVAPEPGLEPLGDEAAILVLANFGAWEHGILMAVELYLAQKASHSWSSRRLPSLANFAQRYENEGAGFFGGDAALENGL
jgi:hypothetical protein